MRHDPRTAFVVCALLLACTKKADTQAAPDASPAPSASSASNVTMIGATPPSEPSPSDSATAPAGAASPALGASASTTPVIKGASSAARSTMTPAQMEALARQAELMQAAPLVAVAQTVGRPDLGAPVTVPMGATANPRADATVHIVTSAGTSEVALGAVTSTVPGADRTIATLKSRFRSCHTSALRAHPAMAGKIQITARVAPNGEVTSADAVTTTVSPELTACALRAVRAPAFDAPGGSGGSVRFAVTFTVAK